MICVLLLDFQSAVQYMKHFIYHDNNYHTQWVTHLLVRHTRKSKNITKARKPNHVFHCVKPFQPILTHIISCDCFIATVVGCVEPTN